MSIVVRIAEVGGVMKQTYSSFSGIKSAENFKVYFC